MSADEDEDVAWQRTLGARLKAAREYVGYTQEEVGNATRIGRPSISLLENGERGVDARELALLCHLYMVSPDAILKADEDAGASWMAPILKAVEPLSPHDRGEVLDFARFLANRPRDPRRKTP